MDLGNGEQLEFGDFSLDPIRRNLYKNGVEVDISAKNFDLLFALLQSGGRVKTHNELLEEVWGESFVEQANLTKGISVLRQLLSEDADRPRYIKTIPRKGYCFVCPVSVVTRGQNGGDIHVTATQVVVEEEIIEDYEESWESADRDTDRLQIEGRSSRSAYRKIAVGALTVVVAIGIYFGARQYLAKGSRYAFSAENVKITKITSEGKLVAGSPSISPNGNYLVYAIRDGDGSTIWTRQLITGIQRQITPKTTGGIAGCLLSPDENFIYYSLDGDGVTSQSGIYRISTFGGTAERVSSLTGSLVISPAGDRLATSRQLENGTVEALTIDTEGRDEKVIWTAPERSRIWDLKYSPDGSTIVIAYRQQTGSKTISRVVEIPSAGGPESVLVPDDDRQISNAVWLPDKSGLLLSIREVNAEIRKYMSIFPPIALGNALLTTMIRTAASA